MRGTSCVRLVDFEQERKKKETMQMIGIVLAALCSVTYALMPYTLNKRILERSIGENEAEHALREMNTEEVSQQQLENEDLVTEMMREVFGDI